MGFGIDYPAFGSVNPLTTTLANTPYAAIDTFNAALENNGATQLLGSLYFAPLVPTGSASAGGGSNPVFRYVRYNPTASQAIKTGPTLVYWKDTTFTTVTGLVSEALSVNAVAGWLLYNTTTLSTATAAQINGNFCWLQVGGYLPGAWVTTGPTAGGQVIGNGATFGANTTIAPGSAITNLLAGVINTVAAANLSDIWVPPLY
jgi:acetyltransferase-like isoleucine patch superfamily enzyme